MTRRAQIASTLLAGRDIDPVEAIFEDTHLWERLLRH
jgi:hypothetical protein